MITERSRDSRAQESPEPETAGGTVVTMRQGQDIALQDSVQQLGRLVVQLGTMIGQMQRRMDEMESRQAQVSVSHAEVKRIQARIRARADAVCGKYGLTDGESARKIRAAIKKQVMARFQIRDLHDLPAGTLCAAERMIDSWTDIRLVMERRAET